jgi:hypothetical protein
MLVNGAEKIRISAEDLDKERGAVLEEYRGGRNATGRMQDSHWTLLFQGSKVITLCPGIYGSMIAYSIISMCCTVEPFDQLIPNVIRCCCIWSCSYI